MAKNLPPILQGLADQSWSGKSVLYITFCCPRTVIPILGCGSQFWRVDACLAFVFSGLRSGWASGHWLPPRNFLQREILTFLYVHSKCLWVEQWLQQLFFKKGLNFALTLSSLNCVYGASRWVIEEGHCGWVGSLRGGWLDTVISALSLYYVVSGTTVSVMGFGCWMECGYELTKDLVPTTQRRTLA